MHPFLQYADGKRQRAFSCIQFFLLGVLRVTDFHSSWSEKLLPNDPWESGAGEARWTRRKLRRSCQPNKQCQQSAEPKAKLTRPPVPLAIRQLQDFNPGPVAPPYLYTKMTELSSTCEVALLDQWSPQWTWRSTTRHRSKEHLSGTAPWVLLEAMLRTCRRLPR